MTARSASLLALGAIVTAIVSLSVHVVMLQLLSVPYPVTSGRIGMEGMLFPLSQTIGILVLSRLIAATFPAWHIVRRCLILALLFSALNGVARAALMEGVTTTGYIAPAAGFVQAAASNLVLAAMAVAVTRWVRGPVGMAIAAIAITGAMLFGVRGALGVVFAPLSRWAAEFARPELYAMPYGPNVLVPSYLSFLETVVACLLTAILFIRDETGPALANWVRFAVTVLLARGTLIAMFVFGPMIGDNPGAGLLSMSQFFLQDLTMVVMIYAVAWIALRSPQQRRSRRNR